MEYDAIIILPNNNEGNLPNEVGKIMCELGVDLSKRGLSDRIVTQGLHSNNLELSRNPITLAQALKNYAVSLGVPFNKILKEEHSVDTAGHPILLAKYFAIPRKWKKICVVTSGYHMVRVAYVFERVFGNKLKIDFINDNYLLEDNRKVKDQRDRISVFEKTFEGIKSGDIEEFYKRLYERHPLYKNR